MTDSSNSLALQRLQDGGRKELTRLFETNRDSLRQMINRRIRGKLSARFDASDIIQESYIRAQSQLESYLSSPRIHPNVWLRLLCKQLLAESIRKHMRVKRSPEFEAQIAGDLLIAERLTDSLHSVVSEELTRAETTQQVREILQTLSDTDREIIEMRHSEGMTFPKIAESLDLKMETAKKRYYRALNRFRHLCSADLDTSSD